MGRRFGTGMVLAAALLLLAMAVGVWSVRGTEAGNSGDPAPASAVDAARAPGRALLFRIEGTRAPQGAAQRISISRDAVARAVRSGELPVVLPDGTRYVVRMAREESAPGGNWTAIGHVDTVVGRQAMVLTFGRDAVFGVLPRPDGFQFQVTTTRGVTTLAPAGGIRPPGESIASAPDMLVPPRVADSPRIAPGAQADPAAPLPLAAPAVPVEIDVLALYTADHAALRGSDAAAESEVTNLFATANQSYLDSGTGVTLRVRRIERVVVGETRTNHEVLNDITNNHVPGIDIHALRDSLAADLVALVRPNGEAHGSCGVAWMNGGGLSANWIHPMWGYSVTNIAPCGPHVLAHELGHNLGSAHDRVTMTSAGDVTYGAYPFSFGFRQNGPPAFGTVMAYVTGQQRWLGLFSDPTTSGCGTPCGIVDHADNVRSLRLMAPRIARFRNPPGSLAIEDARLLEGDGGDLWAHFRVHLSGPAPAGGVGFDLATVDGTATHDVDYQAASLANQSIPAGERETWVSVRVLGDALVEPDEGFFVRLSNVAGATVFDDEALATLVNDDPRVEIGGRVVFPEGSAPPAQPFAVHLDGSGGEGSDAQYVLVSPPDFRYRFAAPRGTRLVLTAYPPAPFVANPAPLGWIDRDLQRDIDAQRGVRLTVRVRAADGVAAPTAPVDVQITETLEGVSRGGWTVAANPPGFVVEHVAAPGAWLTFTARAPGFQVQKALVQRAQTEMEVVLPLHPVDPGLYVWGTLDLTEGSGDTRASHDVIVQLTAPAPAGGVRFDYATVAGTATAGSDFVPVSGTVVIAPGENHARIGFELVGDDLREQVETLSLRVANVTGAVATTQEVTLYIVDDDRKTGGNLKPDPGP